jgi:uncharacterized protein (UPF0335 family)
VTKTYIKRDALSQSLGQLVPKCLLKIFQFVSPALPAARHDIERLRQVKEEIEQGIDARDVLVADKGYQGFEKKAHVGTWYIKKKKHKNREMPKEQVELNAKIESFRRHTEFEFSSVKLIFDCLLLSWRHDRTWLTPVAHFCVAVHKEKVRCKLIGENYGSTWNYPIPQLANPRFANKKVFFILKS